MEDQKKKLRSEAMRGKWEEVFETYKQNEELRTAAITGTGDTILHMAMSNGQGKVVENMLDFLDKDGDAESGHVNLVLRAENERRDTLLHLAATMGNVEMCKKIGNLEPSLIGTPNIAGETPLFLAVLSGSKEAFLELYYMYEDHCTIDGDVTMEFDHCRRKDGNTILHCAIAKGRIDMAIEIIHLYKNFVNEMGRNKEGLFPIHLLGADRSAFKSTTLLERSILVRPIYRLVKAKEKNQATKREELQKKNRQNILVKFPKIMDWLLRLQLGPLVLLGFFLQVWFSWAAILLLLLCVERGLRLMQELKEKHIWTLQIMNELLKHASNADMSQGIPRTVSKQLSISLQIEEDNEQDSSAITIETPLIIAVKNGVIEMVEKILELFPSTVKNVDAEGKNILMLAAEYRHTEVFRFLCKQKWLSEKLFRQVDRDGNNALHLAARLGVKPDWLNPGEALSMSRENDWFVFVKRSTPHDLLERYNRKMEIPDDVFRESHKELKKSEVEWATKTSQACSMVSILVASVAFATRTSVPGGYDNKNGYAIFRNKPPEFRIFEYSSFAALFCSLASTICFLSIAASHSQSVHSWRHVPLNLYIGIYFMFVSIICLWISFCAGNFFMLDDNSRKMESTLPYYISLSLVIILLVITQIPTFFGPTWSRILIPQPRRKATRLIEYIRSENKENVTERETWRDRESHRDSHPVRGQNLHANTVSDSGRPLEPFSLIGFLIWGGFGFVISGGI